MIASTKLNMWEMGTAHSRTHDPDSRCVLVSEVSLLEAITDLVERQTRANTLAGMDWRRESLAETTTQSCRCSGANSSISTNLPL